jgi:Cu/Ag efflux protein CusF
MFDTSAGNELKRRALGSVAAGVALAVALAAAGGTAWADQASTATAAKPAAASQPFVKESLQQMTATVTAVSMPTREVTLRGPSGQTRTIKVGPEARNLDQVHVGDLVTVSYYESFTAQMRRHDKPNEGFMTAEGAVRAKQGDKPGGAAAQSTASTVTIKSVDTKNNTVTFQRPDSVVATIPVMSAEGRAFIAKLKAGDVVDIMYTEAMAIEVAPASAKK